MRQYIEQVIAYRHFWAHLAVSDLRARFRRSYLGILWLVIQPMLLTIIMGSVLKYVFNQTFSDYAIYVYSGMISWDMITGAINIGSHSFIGSEGYIRQVRLPMIIYPLKTILYCGIVFIMAFLGFVAFILVVAPECFGWTWIYMPLTFFILMIFVTPLAIISGIINIKFRDYQQFIGLILQFIWYLSPVMMPLKTFDHPGLREWTAINPVAAIMSALRQPLIEHALPSLHDYALILAYTLFLWGLAVWMLVRNERKIVFYL